MRERTYVGVAAATIVLAGLAGSTVPASGASAADRSDQELLSPDDLEGTVWFSEDEHRRVTVTTCGEVDIKTGKEVYVHFIERVDDLFVIKVRWWNERADLNVLEHGLLTQVAPNVYEYVEADHEGAGKRRDEFPGIIGRGTFELLSKKEAKLIQIGRLVDGSASGFTTTVRQVDELPEPPLAQTYPRFCRS